MKLSEKLREKEKEQDKVYDVLYWKPSEGDVLEGTVTDIGTTITAHGDSDFVQVETDEKKKFMVFCNGLLKRLLDEEEVKKGDYIAIRFKGFVQSKKSKTKRYRNYILVKDDPE